MFLKDSLIKEALTAAQERPRLQYQLQRTYLVDKRSTDCCPEKATAAISTAANIPCDYFKHTYVIEFGSKIL
jgi:hypothetical protein